MKKGFVFLETIIVLTVVTLSLTILLTSYTLITTKAKERENYDRVSDKYLLYTFSNLGTNTTYNYKNIANKGYLKLTPETCTNYQPVQLNEGDFNTESDNFGTATVFKITADGVQTIDPNINCSSNSNHVSCMFFHIFDKDETKVDIDGSTSASEITASACETVMNNLNLKYIYVIPNIQEALESKLATTIFDVGTLNYIKTLRKCYNTDIYTSVDQYGNVIVNDKEVVGSKVCANPVQYLVGVFLRNSEYYFAAIEL